ncbi:MAG: hypothetical protein ACE5LU_16270 [Anaerolineae bacterium]
MHRLTAVLIGTVALVLAAGTITSAPLSISIDFATQDPDLLIAGHAANEYLGADVVTGDLDGDDTDDLVIGAPWASGSGGRDFAGHVHIFFGGEDRPASVSGEAADVTIIGAEARDSLGGGLTPQPGTIAVGDLNDDAFNDLVLGAPDAQGGAGEVRVIFGRSRTSWAATPIMDLASLPADVVVSGADANDGMGSTVAIGDINGDGLGDLIVGAPRADLPQDGRTNMGKVYVFFGRDSWPETLLADDSADFRVIGAQRRDFLGSGLAVGQLGGTDTLDVAIGAPGGAGGGVHVIYGSTSLAGSRDLSATPADWIVHSADSVDNVGRQLRIGDVNGDGKPDLVIGVPRADGPANRRGDSGEVAVLFGPKTSGTTSDLADGVDFVIYGPQGLTGQRPGGHLGDSIALGDFNDDGIMDVIAGSRLGDGFGDARPNTGEAYVIFGGDLPASLDLSAEDADIAIYGRSSGDSLSRVAAGNLDGVSSDDLALGAFRADVADGDVLEKAGTVFVVYQQPVEPPPTSTPTATPTAVTAPTSFAHLPLIMRGH